jgi:hypothetical protein
MELEDWARKDAGGGGDYLVDGNDDVRAAAALRRGGVQGVAALFEGLMRAVRKKHNSKQTQSKTQNKHKVPRLRSG